MPQATLGTAMDPGASSGGKLLAAQAEKLRVDPFSVRLRQDAEQVFADYFERQERPRMVPYGARMFERARHDARLAPALRHALLAALDGSLSKASADYRLTRSPLQQLAALDTWCAETHRWVLDAVSRVESEHSPVPFTEDEAKMATAQQKLLARVLPLHAAKLRALCDDTVKDRWGTRFAGHLRRLLLMTFAATLDSDETHRLDAFLDTAAGRACLAARAALHGPIPPSGEQVTVCDPPEMSDLQNAMYTMMSDAAGDDPYERPAYYIELAARMENLLRDRF